MEERIISSFSKNFEPDINSIQQFTSDKVWYRYIQGFLFKVLKKYVGHQYVQRIFMFQDLLENMRSLAEEASKNPEPGPTKAKKSCVMMMDATPGGS